MELNSLTAISPVDGRYSDQSESLREIFSEYGMIKYRITIEIRWLQTLASLPAIKEVANLSKNANEILDKTINNFSIDDAKHIKEIEKTTNHDVKAVEYFLKERFRGNKELATISEFIHFACTSEDINNLGHGLMLRDAKFKHIIPNMQKITLSLTDFAEQYAGQALLAHTHGQPASPTTLGKEFAIFVHRLHRQQQAFKAIKIGGKFNGAVGNFNAHLAAYPELDWMKISESFVESQNLTWNPHTTQIEPHDYMAEYFHALIRFNTVLIDFCRDTWGYISLCYLKQKISKGENWFIYHATQD